MEFSQLSELFKSILLKLSDLLTVQLKFDVIFTIKVHLTPFKLTCTRFSWHILFIFIIVQVPKQIKLLLQLMFMNFVQPVHNVTYFYDFFNKTYKLNKLQF